MKAWGTRQVRAYNLKPGDVIPFFNLKTLREVRRTVAGIEPEGDDQIIIRFRRWRPTLGMLVKRTSLMRVRRLEVRP